MFVADPGVLGVGWACGFLYRRWDFCAECLVAAREGEF